MPEDSTLTVEFYINTISTDGLISAAWKLVGTFNRDGASSPIQAGDTSVIWEHNPSGLATPSLAPQGNQIEVTGSGLADKNWVWKVAKTELFCTVTNGSIYD